jgi:phytoene dehydrogenase-like protein
VKKVVIGGGGHNSLIAACYLAKAGVDVTILEKGVVGGATVSQKVFEDYEARLSRYAYLISLLPDQIVKDLDIKSKTISRSVASFTPTFKDGKNISLLVNTKLGEKTKSNFKELTGSDTELEAWQSFYDDVSIFAKAVAPTMLKKLPTRSELKALVNHPIWDELVEKPIGESLDKRFADDIIKGIVLTDGLIGTYSTAYELYANVCFIYHLIGNGVGEWKVPEGGMGAFVSELYEKAKSLGVKIVENSEVIKVSQSGEGYLIESKSGEFSCDFFLVNFAPQIFAKIMGTNPPKSLDGAQIKINMLLKKLPRLKSGEDPTQAFAGTFHFDESYTEFQRAYDESRAGKIPSKIPAEMYCHTLTDQSILSSELAAQGYQTLTLFGMHLPANLFDKNNEAAKHEVKTKLLAQLNNYLVDPIEECLATTKDGSLCIEVKSPQDVEKDVSLPRGNIFQKDLSMPFREDGTEPSWGVETEFKNIFLCGAGAIRGGGVSGIPGHNAAAAVLEVIKGNQAF